jgi:hypothetical protein
VLLNNTVTLLTSNQTCLVRTSVGLPDILTEDVRNFTQTLQENVGSKFVSTLNNRFTKEYKKSGVWLHAFLILVLDEGEWLASLRPLYPR